ncbi:uncharacterized protein LOC122633042 [Vespula pensylvanica]|uniref:uncharacterized protein LOC122633042 n=1 Tax=Vespula pensylvanica TaxID=30213 RepID=UPI001CBA2287|nr:uncharacterized protein LOC122633042 [Vespula pensylvanica]
MMKRLTLNERTKIVQFYFENNRSIISTQRAYRRHFNVKNAPAEMTIRNIIARFQQQGTVSDLPRSGRPRSVFTNANIQRVEESVLEEPGTSTRRRSSQLELSRTSLRRISRHLLLLFPYKIQLVQDLHLDDYKSRLNFSIRFQQLVKEEDDFLDRLIMSDQADFHLDGIINKENCIFWGAVNPTAIRDYQLHPIKCTVWCGLTSDCVIGPFFFKNDDGNNAAIVTVERYKNMIENFLRPAVEDKPDMWFQQDENASHTAEPTMEILREIFSGRLISKQGAIEFPERSPDLTATDFFLWGYLKGKVYRNKPRTIQQLQENIRTEIHGLSRQTLRTVMENILQRMKLCQTENGRYLRDVIFHG